MESFFEYVVKPPVGYEKTRRRKRNLIILYLFVGVILPVAVLFIPFVNRLIVPAFFVCVITDIAVFYLTWPKTKPEYEYAIELDEFRLSVIYGGRIRRVLIRTELRKAELIAPNNGMYKNKINDFAPEREYFGAFTEDQINYFMLFTNENYEKCILYFSAEVEQIKHFKRLNGRTVVDRTHKITENE